MTPVTQISQLALSFYAALLGVALGCVYDGFRILRIAFPCPERDSPHKTLRRVMLTAVFIEDILFALICSVSVNLFLFNLNDGQVRWYAIAGAGLGFLVWYCTAGKLVILFANAIIGFIRRILRFLFYILLYPPIQLGRRLFIRIQKTVGTVASSVLRRLWARRLIAAARNEFSDL